LKNAVETAKIAVDSCYVPRQFLTPLPSIDFREIRGLPGAVAKNATIDPLAGIFLKFPEKIHTPPTEKISAV
jgi:hypothetical protein